MINILIWIALGIAAGSLAKAAMSGKEPGGFLLTTLLGIGGAFVGGWIGRFAFGSVPFLKESAGAEISISSIVTATIGAIVLLAVYRAVKK